jgi:hypothetical protein
VSMAYMTARSSRCASWSGLARDSLVLAITHSPPCCALLVSSGEACAGSEHVRAAPGLRDPERGPATPPRTHTPAGPSPTRW